jgi:hydroxymethylpyrimidine pyrophosphatase-like HAD family hydrolase
MRYHALICDYDGTLAHDGHVDQTTLAALERVLGSGRQLVLVTGRELPELQSIFDGIDMFSRVVAENGAVIYRPDSREFRLLASPPPEDFPRRLRELGVHPLTIGQVVVATWRPQEHAVLQAIHDLGLEMQVIFNKDAVMALPAGVNKASGLLAALDELNLSVHETVGIGDAENDHAFLSLCECAVAVDNALPAVKKRVDLVTKADHGAGVTELIDSLIENDLANLNGKLTRHFLKIGTDSDGKDVCIAPYGVNVMIAGPSGSGKSTIAASFLERLAERKYQYCVIDPEGDYSGFPGTVALGSPERAPSLDEVLQMIATTHKNTVLNLIGLAVKDRPSFFLGLLPRIQELRVRTGQPHWLIIDEAHHLLPASWEPGTLLLPREPARIMYITVHPDQVAPAVLQSIDSIIAVGPKPETTIGQFCSAIKEAPPEPVTVAEEEVAFWSRREKRPPKRVRMIPGSAERRRHTRKYAEGELPPERSFYFRGPEAKLNLRAQNLILFLQIADGVDDETWLFHLRNGDYSRWFRDRIKDDELALEAARIERQGNLPAKQSRAAIKSLIERNYTEPAGPPLPMPGTDAAARSSIDDSSKRSS